MIGAALGMGRRAAEARMLDTVTVTRPGAKVWNEATGEWTVTVSTVYSGKARIKHGPAARDVEAGSQLLAVGQLEVHVPVGTAGFEPDDTVTVSGSATRPAQVGRVFTVLAPFDGSQTTALRYRVESDDGR